MVVPPIAQAKTKTVERSTDTPARERSGPPAHDVHRLQRAIGNRATRRLLHSSLALQRQPETTVRVGKTDQKLTLGAGGSGAVVYEYPAVATAKPPDLTDLTKSGASFEIKLPVLVYVPKALDPAKVSVFVFFHGMRATYEEGTKTQRGQGEEPIAVWTHLKEAIGATDRLGIAPQAPQTWVASKDEKTWKLVSAQWNEALSKIGFDGLIDTVMKGLTTDLKLPAPLVPSDIHMAGHSAGGKGIIEATNLAGGGKTFGDKIQDVTLQDAGYGFAHWDNLMNWFLDGTPGKTIRVLISHAEGGTPDAPRSTRNVLKTFNIDAIKETIEKKGKTDLEVVDVPAPKPEDQKPRPGGFLLESQLIVTNMKTKATQGTLVVFFAPGGQHYPSAGASMGAAAAAGPTTAADFLGEATAGKYRAISDGESPIGVFKEKDLKKQITSLKRDTVVDVISTEWREPTTKEDTSPQPYIANVKTSEGVEGWMRLANLARE